ncbi:MAG: hypothetical protein WA324_30380 [Bryobacteraceae bacterium]
MASIELSPYEQMRGSSEGEPANISGSEPSMGYQYEFATLLDN